MGDSGKGDDIGRIYLAEEWSLRIICFAKNLRGAYCVMRDKILGEKGYATRNTNVVGCRR